MEDAEKTKEFIRERYGSIAKTGSLPAASCCGGSNDLVSIAESYAGVEGHAAEADLSLGCGLPTAFAGIQPGETVLDLGSGAGNDAFVAARAAGETGRVIGVDMTPEMVEKARRNAGKLGARNVEFRLGEIEALPVESGTVDLVISNCVLNLVPDKGRAFAEIFRVLKPGGRFTVSDVVLEGPLPEPVRKSAELWAGCVSGALVREDYLRVAQEAGFALKIEKERRIEIPEDAIASALGAGQVSGPVTILSITLTGVKRRTEA